MVINIFRFNGVFTNWPTSLTSQESEAEQHADMLAHASTTAVLAAAGHETIPPNSQEQTVEVVKSIPQERVVERTMAQLVDVTPF